jgi:hypothetical protein
MDLFESYVLVNLIVSFVYIFTQMPPNAPLTQALAKTMFFSLFGVFLVIIHRLYGDKVKDPRV